ncbi:MAG: RIP metalloprotease RseP [Eubacteriales bacterium]|nr:RIP metalloprotease RseP [Eubacteriales bacterium]
MSTFVSILLTLLLIGILTTVHEFGHFMAARLCGIPVKRFSVGIGKRLITWKGKKHDTEFSLSLLPVGGYCMFYDDYETELDKDIPKDTPKDPRAFSQTAVWKRLICVVSGPLMNFVLALVVSLFYFWLTAFSLPVPVIGTVSDGMPAQTAGFMAGDEIVAVNGEKCTSTAEIGVFIRSYQEGSAPVRFTVKRGGETLEIPVVPNLVTDENNQSYYQIGIVYQLGEYRLSFSEAAQESFAYFGEASTLIIKALVQLVSGKESLQNMSSVVGIVGVMRDEVAKVGLTGFLSLLIMISINLGLFNLLPFPGLDGARIVFFLIEAVRGKPVNQKVEAYIHMVGLGLLMLLTVFLVYQDIVKLI